VDQDEALRRARQDLVGAHAVAAEWEAEVVSAHAQLQRDRATLEGARAWQSQAEERAKEAEELRASLVDKAAAVVTAEEQLRQERVDGPVLETNNTRFILVPARAVRRAAVCSGHCIALHRGARRGGLQAWRERRPGLQVPEVLIEASANIVVKAESVCVFAVPRPPATGGLPSFYRTRREQFTCVPHYSPTCGGVASSATELTAILANPAPVGAS
jgi:hypothetical protein